MKCPLCNSLGDDLVFRFYCSNSLCKNFVPKCDPEKDIEVAPKKDSCFKIPKVMLDFPIKPCVRWVSFVEKVIPEFTIVETDIPQKWQFMWKDKIPRMLAILVASYLEKYIGESACNSTFDAICDDVSVYLHQLKSCGNLVWNDWCRKWELHFTD